MPRLIVELEVSEEYFKSLKDEIKNQTIDKKDGSFPSGNIDGCFCIDVANLKRNKEDDSFIEFKNLIGVIF